MSKVFFDEGKLGYSNEFGNWPIRITSTSAIEKGSLVDEALRNFYRHDWAIIADKYRHEASDLKAKISRLESENEELRKKLNSNPLEGKLESKKHPGYFANKVNHVEIVRVFNSETLDVDIFDIDEVANNQPYSDPEEVAREYAEAHDLLPKPWRKAQVGELWAVTTAKNTQRAFVVRGLIGREVFHLEDGEFFNLDNERILDAVRLEVVEEDD